MTLESKDLESARPLQLKDQAAMELVHEYTKFYLFAQIGLLMSDAAKQGGDDISCILVDLKNYGHVAT